MEFFHNLTWPGAIAFIALCLMGSVFFVASFISLSDMEITFQSGKDGNQESVEINKQSKKQD